ncbi:putative Poly(U)-specific endoribonuclease-D [Hypsibius exemplaris]|uniref:Uridylate-specific endoribonuclease n=1 Tax=Hypsibius exemplaris TaxID=2072580 RepID=A0A9X6NLR8_HYPEX|nr:putative Poly(U)-specific endoribonuclease-D [Hypsibius exemplaris]
MLRFIAVTLCVAVAISVATQVRPAVKPRPRSKAALTDFTVIMQRLWDLDVNGMSAATMRLALQGRTNSTSKLDEAPQRLFAYVNETFLLSRPTVLAFIAVSNNYEPRIGTAERETAQEQAEINAFLNAVCDTEVMKATLAFLQEQKQPFPTMAALKAHLKSIWFTLYPRSKNPANVIDSSGFEHVFLGEAKKTNVIGGLHNWIHAYRLEKTNILNYTGYVNSVTVLEPGRFIFGARLWAYNNYWKNPFSSFIFGASPEFDLASYTICFTLRPNKNCPFRINNKSLSIRTMRYMPNLNYVDTAYPDVPF